MARKQKWDILLKEKLFAAACDHSTELAAATYEITEDSDVIRSIHKTLDEADFDPRAVLYQLAEIKVLGIKPNSRLSGIFFRPSGDTDINNFKIGPSYPAPSTPEIQEIINRAPRKTGAAVAS